MTDALIPAEAAPETEAAAEVSDPYRPDGLPDKFWDPDAGAVRVDALVKSYTELERKMGGVGSRLVPDSPDDYAIQAPDDLFTPDPEVNAALHAAGFSQEQAQVVYDLAAEKLGPMLESYSIEHAAARDVERLTEHFGGSDKWREASRQLAAWGKANLPTEVFEALSTSYEGVLALQGMMAHGEPGLIRGGDAAGGTDEASLRQMMKDPRYWRDRDPAFAEQVAEGFRRIYGDAG